jgi:probable phosphoglycerate mutase
LGLWAAAAAFSEGYQQQLKAAIAMPTLTSGLPISPGKQGYETLSHIYLIRHGEAIEDLKDGTYQDLGLSSEEVKQTELLRDRLARTGEIKADVLIASPLPRAQASTRILAPALRQSIILDDDVREWRCDDGRISPEEFNAR